MSGATAVVAGDRTVTVRSLNNLRVGMNIVVGPTATRELRRIDSISGNDVTVDRPFAAAHAILSSIFTQCLAITSHTAWSIDGLSVPPTLIDTGRGIGEFPERWRPEAVYF